jgi:hypothetical protein
MNAPAELAAGRRNLVVYAILLAMLLICWPGS